MPPRTPVPPSAPYHPCPQCATPVLTGQTSTGAQVTVEPGTPTFTLVWNDPHAPPMLSQSRAYPVHRCGHKEQQP
jgi:hypothetical protein